MTDLYDRLLPQFAEDTPKIAVKPFVYLLAEYVDGKVSVKDLAAKYQLRGEEVDEYQRIIALLDGMKRAQAMKWLALFERVLVLAEQNMAYTTKASLYDRVGLSR